jgi:hypothetical protein
MKVGATGYSEMSIHSSVLKMEIERYFESLVEYSTMNVEGTGVSEMLEHFRTLKIEAVCSTK